MRAAIEGARGGNGLGGREARDLQDLLNKFDHALDEQDPSAAREQANELAQQVADLVDQGDVEGQAAERLTSAANELVAAANAIPD
jgi:plasmid stabilization system protein ParE